MMRARDLTPEERWLYAPWHEKLLVRSFLLLLPFVGAIDTINL